MFVGFRVKLCRCPKWPSEASRTRCNTYLVQIGERPGAGPVVITRVGGPNTVMAIHNYKIWFILHWPLPIAPRFM